MLFFTNNILLRKAENIKVLFIFFVIFSEAQGDLKEHLVPLDSICIPYIVGYRPSTWPVVPAHANQGPSLCRIWNKIFRVIRLCLYVRFYLGPKDLSTSVSVSLNIPLKDGGQSICSSKTTLVSVRRHLAVSFFNFV